MKPAWSVILLTTLIGAGQGLFIALYAAEILAGLADAELLAAGGMLAAALAALGLFASFFHLGRPEKAWRAASQWRTSWLSREVIVLPAFIAGAALYGLAHHLAWPAHALIGALTFLICIALFVCTGMIYACIKFLQEWASPLTLVNFALLGSASGFTFATALAAVLAPPWVRFYGQGAMALTLLALAFRVASLARNARLRPKSTLQSAIGVRHSKIEQKSQGFTGTSFNTREFFHGRTPQAVRGVKWGFLILGFVAPVLLIASQLEAASARTLAGAFALQYLGLLAERWFFFAQANHPQNLYYQAIS